MLKRRSGGQRARVGGVCQQPSQHKNKVRKVSRLHLHHSGNENVCLSLYIFSLVYRVDGLRGFPPADIFTTQALRTADHTRISCVCTHCAGREVAQVAPDTGTSAHANTPGSRERLPSRELPPPPASRAPPEWKCLLMENLSTVPTDRVRPPQCLVKIVGTVRLFPEP